MRAGSEPTLEPITDDTYAYNEAPSAIVAPTGASSSAQIASTVTQLADHAATVTGHSPLEVLVVLGLAIVAVGVCCCLLACQRCYCNGDRQRPLRKTRAQDEDVKRRLAEDQDDDDEDDEEEGMRRGGSAGTFPQRGSAAEDELYLE